LNHEVISIDLDQKRVTFSNDRVETHDYLINATPLDLLVKSWHA